MEGSPRTRVLLDGNIYNRLAQDEASRTLTADHVYDNRLEVIVTPILLDELAASPFGGVPDWFPVKLMPEAVIVFDYARWDLATFGEGEVYDAHRGDSNKVPDAIVADSAAGLADVFVSEDRRCRTRLAALGTACRVMSYDEFSAWLRNPA